MVAESNNKAILHRPPLAEEFEAIKTIDEQQWLIDTGTLERLARIILRHQHDGNYGVCLLHRHGHLIGGHVMVHSYPGTGLDKCEMLPFKEGRHFPCSYLVNKEHRLLPFEYCAVPQAEPTEAFAAEFARFLVQNKLEDVLALCTIFPSSGIWMEYVTDNDGNTIAIQIETGNSPRTPNIVTQWAFSSEGNQVRIRPLRECVRPEGGGHRKPGESVSQSVMFS